MCAQYFIFVGYLAGHDAQKASDPQTDRQKHGQLMQPGVLENTWRGANNQTIVRIMQPGVLENTYCSANNQTQSNPI